jgi:hypothetical protein
MTESTLDLFSEETQDDFAELGVDVLPNELTPAMSSVGTFTSGSSFSCPGSTVGTFSTLSTWS